MPHDSRWTETGPETDDDDEDALIAVKVALPHHAAACSETLWCDRVGDEASGQYLVRSIPQYAYGLNWGDVIEAAPANNDEAALTVVRVVSPGGHRTLRVTFLRRMLPRERAPALDELRDFGLSYEGSPMQTVAVDVPPSADYDAALTHLRALAAEGRLHLETGEARAPGSFDDAPAADAAAAMQSMVNAAASYRRHRSRRAR